MTSAWNVVGRVVAVIQGELDERQRLARAAHLDCKLDGWATELAQLWGKEAAPRLVRRYGSWIRELGGGEGDLDPDDLAEVRMRFITKKISDAELTGFDLVRLVLEEIYGKYNDGGFLNHLDHVLLPKWKAMEDERRKIDEDP